MSQDRALHLLNKYKMEQMQKVATTQPPPEVHKRHTVCLMRMQKRARRQAESAFAEKDDDESSMSPDDAPLTPYQKKKVMRNKSAFISRRRQKNYVQLLENFVVQLEVERDRELDNCVRNQVEVHQLKMKEEVLREQLKRLQRSRPRFFQGDVQCTMSQPTVPRMPSMPMVDIMSGSQNGRSQFHVGGPSRQPSSQQRFGPVEENGVQDPLSDILDDAIGQKWEF